jgi:hypothetical protein
MIHLKLFEEFTSSFEMDEKSGEITLSIGHSFINFFYLKDTHNLVEFTNLDLNDVYQTIGEECIYIDKMSVNPKDKENMPHLVREFIDEVERYAKEMNVNTICLIAEPFGTNKRKTLDELISMYKHFGFIIYEKLPGKESYMMYKDI